MSQIDNLFASLRQVGRKALIPFVTAGDPDLTMTTQLISAFSELGCPICEIGFPYSDPIADGPVIQASYQRALDQGLRTADIFRSVAEISAQTAAALVGMVSVAIIRRRGVESFLREAKRAGFAGFIVPDLPCEEAVFVAEACRREQLSFIPLITPTTTDERVRRVVVTASGFIYFVSVTGITGERAEIPQSTLDRIQWLRQETDLPICLGFGISQAAQVARAAEVVDGVIVGSAIVRRIAEAPHRDQIVPAVRAFVSDLVAALPS